MENPVSRKSRASNASADTPEEGTATTKSERKSTNRVSHTSAPLPETPDAKVKVLVEPAVGEFGPLFALIAGVIFLGLSTAIAMFFSTAIMEQVSKLPESYQTVAKDARVVPEYSETTGFIAFLALSGLATVVLMVGAFLAALETRGRLRRRIEPGSIIVTTDQAKVGVSTQATLPVDVEKVINAATGLVERLGSLRGTTAVIGAAVLLYGGAVAVLLTTR